MRITRSPSDLKQLAKMSLWLGLLLNPPLSWAQVSGNGERSFWAEGADTNVGLGARYIAMGGVGTAIADDIYAAYYNPAGASELKGFSVAASTQTNAKFHNFSFQGLGWGLPIDESAGYRVGIALAFYPRVHASATGAYTGKEFESIFVRYLLPGVPEDFNGNIESKTKSYRVALGVQNTEKRWSVGAYVEHIDCRSNFCGVHAQSNGYTVDSTGAKAYGFGFGARYKFDYDWTGGVQISDVNTKLDVNESITDNLGTRNRQFKSAFPRRVTVEIAKRISSNWIAAVQHDKFQGAYGGSMLDIQMIRAGTEYQSGAWRYRAGALIPLRIYSDQSESVKLPLPFAPTMGLGWVNRDLDLSLAVSSHPVMSVHKNNAAPTVDLSVTYHF